ncbi:DNA topology modulation protein [Tepidibacter sp. Z1-5]|uniref:DNA topology modulation protein n=1 Tax=Tepidibacter sp. Z1-5 TaxID=3134138 RepID=UPI0030BCC815
MKKIMIIGSGGAGKSTLARKLGNIINIEVIHLDKLFWKSNWVETEYSEWVEIIKKQVKKKSWIIDGNYASTMDIRLIDADTIIFLDFSRYICLLRAIKRRFMYKNKSRPDITEGCVETFDLEFFGWIWNFPKSNRNMILKKLDKYKNEKNIFILKNQKELMQFLSGIEKNNLK